MNNHGNQINDIKTPNSFFYSSLSQLKGTLLENRSNFLHFDSILRRVDRVRDAALDGKVIERDDLIMIMGFCSAHRKRLRDGAAELSIDVIESFLSRKSN